MKQIRSQTIILIAISLLFKSRLGLGFGGYLDPDVYLTKKGRKAINDSEKTFKRRKKRYNLEKKRFMKLIKSKPDILLTHFNPLNYLDKMRAKGFALSGSNMGVGYFNIGIKKYKPKLVICGHLHENQGKQKLGKTMIVNTGAAADGKAAIIDIDEKSKKIKVKFIK